MNHSEKGLEVDLGKLLALLRKKWHLLFLGGLLGILLSLGLTKLLITPQYQSSVTLYVQQTQSSKDLADSFEVIVKMRESLMDVVDYTGMGYNHVQLQKQISVRSVNETDFFQVTVSAATPQEAAMIANSIGLILPRQIGEIMDGTTVKMVSEAIPALKPAIPNYPNTALLGFASGLLIGLGAVLIPAWFPKKRDADRKTLLP